MTTNLELRDEPPYNVKLKVENERMRSALKPFAHAGGSKSAEHNDLNGALSTISMDDLRFAFRAVQGEK